MTQKVIKLFFVIIILSGLVYAQDLKWDGELRIRSELDNRDFKNLTPPNYYTLFRARLGAEFVPIENLKFYFQIQDSRLFGEEKNIRNEFSTIANTKNLDIHQAFIQLDKFLLNEISLKIGRQQLAFGNERFVGVVGWNNVGRIFDGGLIKLNLPKNSVSLFLMNTGETNILPVTSTPDEFKFVRDAGQLFSGLNWENAYFENHLFEFFTYHQLNRNVSVPGYNDLSRFTSGFYGKGRVIDKFFYETDVAYQYGWRRGMDISAYLVAFTLGYNLNLKPLSSLSISFENLSGNKANENKYQTFDLPYASGHKFFGYMDYFIVIPLNTYQRGLQDIFAKLNFKFIDNLNGHIVIHNFNLSEKLDDEKLLGQELDIVINWKYNKYIQFEFGGGVFVPGKVMRVNFTGYDVSHWGYLTTLMQF